MPFQPQGEDTNIRDSLAMRQLGATISPKDIQKAETPYKIENASVKGKTDTQLYNMAETAVIKWWQRQQTTKIRAQDKGKTDTAAEKKALQKMNAKVDTALGRIPALNLKAQQRAAERAQEARQMKNELLRGTGLWGIQPPSYAMTSVSALQAWINRQVARRNALASARRDYNL